ncbi:hypothetical protein Y032_0083g1646 [Ancylostoma ceylanicum]|uniref:Uncharacterized protein n=1 Tax=Ancylostoma ceylanicum TaxID=53326 RepID=A0A016TRD1_9BILA|nr:hypothetical protein Y032_0083g1646 [Ancylostoma ceylanicum]
MGSYAYRRRLADDPLHFASPWFEVPTLWKSIAGRGRVVDASLFHLDCTFHPQSAVADQGAQRVSKPVGNLTL